MTRIELTYSGEHHAQSVQDQIDDAAGYTATFTINDEVQAQLYRAAWVAPQKCSLWKAAAYANTAPSGDVRIALRAYARTPSGPEFIDDVQFTMESGENYAEWETSGWLPLRAGDLVKVRVSRPNDEDSYALGEDLTIHMWLVNG